MPSAALKPPTTPQPDFAALAEQHGTPLFVYRKSVLKRQADALASAFPGCLPLYSMKCNPHPDLCRFFADRGFGMDTCSGQETLFAKSLGLAPDHICYSAPGKTREDIEACLGCCRLVADSWSELELIDAVCRDRGIQLEAGLRISPAIRFGAGLYPDILPAAPDKFGVPEEEIDDRAAWLASLANVRVAHLHTYVRSQVLSAQALGACFAHAADIALHWHGLGLPLSSLNLGGGFGIPCRQEEPLDLAEVGRTVGQLKARLSSNIPNLAVLIESGRFLAGEAGFFVSRILDVKQSRGTTYAVCEGMLNHFLRPPLARLISSLQKALSGGEPFPGPCEPLWSGPGTSLPFAVGKSCPAQRVTVCGSLCTVQDTAAEDVELANIAPGNLLVFPNAGAYAAALSPHGFGFQKGCAEVLAD